MTWTTARDQLRNLLSDGVTDKLRYRKTVIGILNGTNKNFKTFEDRRLDDFTTGSTSGIGVFVDGTLATVTADLPELGEFTLTTAPNNDQTVEATYYQQWFKDSELDSFLESAALWLGYTDVSQIDTGLRSAVLKYSGADSYQKLALRWAQNYSDVYKMQDQDPDNKPVNPYSSLSKMLRADATESRNEFYKRQGRALQPLHNSLAGRVGAVTPKR